MVLGISAASNFKDLQSPWGDLPRDLPSPSDELRCKTRSVSSHRGIETGFERGKIQQDGDPLEVRGPGFSWLIGWRWSLAVPARYGIRPEKFACSGLPKNHPRHRLSHSDGAGRASRATAKGRRPAA